MSILFPGTSLDSFPNPTGSDLMENATAALDHDVQHSNVNDAVEALEAKVGINGSAVTTSHDYKLSAVTGSAKALTSGTSTQAVTNLALTTPTIAVGSDATGDMYYRNGSGVLTRLGIGATGQILEAQVSSIPAWVANPAATDASTTAKGVVEEATLAETLARTTAGSTSARLFVNPSTLTSVLKYDSVTDTGSSTAYAIAPTPAVTAYVTNQEFVFKAVNANTTTTPTLAVSGLASPKTIVKLGGQPLLVGDIQANSYCHVVYNGTQFELVSSVPGGKMIAYSHTQTVSPSNTSENTLKTLSGHVMGANDKLVLRGAMSINVSGGVTNTYRFKFGSTTIASFTSAISAVYNFELTVVNRNSTSSQYYTLQAINTSSTVVMSVGTASFATGSAFDVVVTGQSTNSTDSTCEFADTEIIKG
jgi:hypothetical protein